MSELFGLLPCFLLADNHISETDFADLGNFLFKVIKLRKRQHIRRLVNTPILFVELVYLIKVNKCHTDFTAFLVEIVHVFGLNGILCRFGHFLQKFFRYCMSLFKIYFHYSCISSGYFL